MTPTTGRHPLSGFALFCVTVLPAGAASAALNFALPLPVAGMLVMQFLFTAVTVSVVVSLGRECADLLGPEPNT